MEHPLDNTGSNYPPGQREEDLYPGLRTRRGNKVAKLPKTMTDEEHRRQAEAFENVDELDSRYYGNQFNQ